MKALQPLLGRTLLVLAHPDDECVTYGALLQRMADPIVRFMTDGAPHDPYFWSHYGSREAYAALRQQEARRALARIGVQRVEFVSDGYHGRERDGNSPRGGRAASDILVDQELFRILPAAWRELADAVERLQPQALLTLAYEGGHPDHDSCNLLVSLAARRFKLPAWEAPIYNRADETSDGRLEPHRFSKENGTEIDVRPTAHEVEQKRAMWREYASQGDFLEIFSPEKESMRPLAAYDYSKPPHPGQLNYERWQWSMTGNDVCRAFVSFLEQMGEPGSEGDVHSQPSAKIRS
ncbi:MAG: PIG-L family deacetylase [Candidatus Korobacteraceae bacterium]